jgi:hypothetical protein
MSREIRAFAEKSMANSKNCYFYRFRKSSQQQVISNSTVEIV